ncbi:MAG: TetR/AcrR family transcriptional regulator [Ilumatobacteraceae bacterium]
MLEGLEQLLRDGELGVLTVGELAATLECSRRTLYELAKSKDQLMLLVVDRVMHRIGETALAAIDFDVPAAVQLRQYATASIGYANRTAAVGELADIPGVRRVVDAHYRFAATVLEGIVATGIDRDEFRRVDAAVTAVAILAGAVRFSQRDVLDRLGLSLEDALGEMLDLILVGLLDPHPG